MIMAQLSSVRFGVTHPIANSINVRKGIRKDKDILKASWIFVFPTHIVIVIATNSTMLLTIKLNVEYDDNIIHAIRFIANNITKNVVVIILISR